MAFGLVYDALILALGRHGAGGALFLPLSRFRFVFHGALIPLLFPICAYALDFKKPWKIAVWVLTGIVIALGIAEGFATVLIRRSRGRYRALHLRRPRPPGPGRERLLSFGTVIPLMIAGIAVWIRQKTPLLFLSGFLMFLFSALGPATGNTDLIFYISMFGEVGMALFFLLYARPKARKRKSKGK